MIARSGEECVNAMYVDGIGPIVSLECITSLGGLDLDGNVYGYGVDVWLSYRAMKAGWGVWVDHTLIVRHKLPCHGKRSARLSQ
jgi:GT2 family glycosyltransferase